MTNREFFNAIINSSMPNEYKEHAQGELDKLDAKNTKRKNTPTKTQRENEGLMATIVEYISANGASVASEIGTALGVSTQKASALCKLLVDAKTLAVADVKVKGKGTVKQYSLVKSDEG